jgi:hypothetical protein
MTKKHRAKTGKNASHGNASKEVNKIVRALNARPCISTAIPGKIRPAKGGTNNPEVRFQRMDGKTKLKCVVRLRNVVQELIIIAIDEECVSVVKRSLGDM